MLAPKLFNLDGLCNAKIRTHTNRDEPAIRDYVPYPFLNQNYELNLEYPGSIV